MVLTLLLAFVLDLLFGDPRFIPHPICFIGKLISFLENKLRKNCKNEIVAGRVLWIIVVIISCFLPLTILIIAFKINVYLGFALNVFFCWQILAAKSLKVESTKVYTALKNKDIGEARKYLSYIVGRDTQNLNEEEIIKATVETVAENTSDGVVAPMLFMAVGGAPLGFLYKAINTMDSMLGYKNEKYINFGRFSAKTDDVANYLPARLSGILMVASAFILGLNYKNSAKIYKRDRKNHASPNSAQTESSCAGALDVQLGGNAEYFGTVVKKKTIGDNNKPLNCEDIKKANKLMYVTAVLALGVSLGLCALIWWVLPV